MLGMHLFHNASLSYSIVIIVGGHLTTDTIPKDTERTERVEYILLSF